MQNSSPPRRQLLAQALILGAAPFVPKFAKAQSSTVSVVGNPGLHHELWKRWATMLEADTNGALKIKYDPVGYAPAYARIKLEFETKNFATDIFYNDAPFPEQLWNEGMLQEIPYKDMPHAQKLYPYARRPYGLEVFNTVWGIVGFNQNFVKASDFQGPLSWEEFTNPRWKGKVSWVDPRAFPAWLPIIVNTYGEDKWIDYARRLDANVKTYHPRWVDNRIGMQRGDAWLTFHNWATIYIGAKIDRANVAGIPISSPKPAMGNLPISMSILKNAPNRAAAVRMMDLCSQPQYTKVLHDIGLNPSNHPDNHPHSMPVLMLQVNNADRIGVTKFDQIPAFVKPINWVEWAGKVSKYSAQWEQEVLRKRTA